MNNINKNIISADILYFSRNKSFGGIQCKNGLVKNSSRVFHLVKTIQELQNARLTGSFHMTQRAKALCC